MLLVVALALIWVWFGQQEAELEVNLDGIWCEGFAAGQVVVADPMGIGKPGLEQWDGMIATCLELKFPSRPISIYHN